MCSLRWHFTNKSVAGAPYSIKSQVLQSVIQPNTMVKSTMTETVQSWGRGGTAAAMAQNEQTTEQRSTLDQQWPRKLDLKLSYMVWSAAILVLIMCRWNETRSSAGCLRFRCVTSTVTLKMHDLKMTDKENYGSGKCRTGEWRTNFQQTVSTITCVFLMCIWRTIVRHFSN